MAMMICSLPVANMTLFALLMLPGLSFMIFVVIQFLYRGQKEIGLTKREKAEDVRSFRD